MSVDWRDNLIKRATGHGSFNYMTTRSLSGSTFFLGHAATQLDPEVQQERSQVVCRNKEARKLLTESNGTPAMDLGHMDVGSKWRICMVEVDLGIGMILFIVIIVIFCFCFFNYFFFGFHYNVHVGWDRRVVEEE